MLTQTFSMFQQGLSQSSVWQEHARIGCSLAFAKRSDEASRDGTCGASPAREGGYEMRPNKVLMNCPIKIRYGIFQHSL